MRSFKYLVSRSERASINLDYFAKTQIAKLSVIGSKSSVRLNISDSKVDFS